MNYNYSFEKLEVWKDSRQYVKHIYELTNKFPKSETYGIASQVQRAAVSIVSNIAEGVSRRSFKEQIRFIEIAYASSIETYCQLIISYDLGFTDINEFDSLKNEIQKITNKLSALRRTIESKIND